MCICELGSGFKMQNVESVAQLLLRARAAE
jgi:hypothetical protein